jgi:DHA3 family tetracycline resistance protein-like MFS transporter
MASQVVWGIGATFISGAAEAWIADEIGPDVASHAYLRAAQVGRFTGLLGIGLSVALGSIQLAVPIVVGGALFLVLAGFLLLFMPEQGFQPMPPEERHSWRALTRTLRDGVRLVRVRPALVIVLFSSLFYGMFSEGADRLWRAHLLENFTLPALGSLDPIVWFGIINAVGMGLAILSTEVAR